MARWSWWRTSFGTSAGERNAAASAETHRPSHPRRRARSAAPGVLRHRHHHHRLPADLHAAARGRPAVQAHGFDGRLRPAGRADIFHPDRARAGQRVLPQRSSRMAQPGHGLSHRALSDEAALGHQASLDHGRRGRRRRSAYRPIWPSAESSARSFCRTWTKAPSGRAARWPTAPASPRARASRTRRA